MTDSNPRAAPMPRWLGVTLILLIAVAFSSNHIAARLAFDHGVNVLTAVVVRSIGTAVFVALLLRVSGTPMSIPAGSRVRVVIIGLLLVGQSYCLYSAIARLPVALGLLAFNTFPFVLGLVSWFDGGERPSRRTWLAMTAALIGLALALDAPGKLTGTGADISLAGVAFAFGASLFFALVLHLTTQWLPNMDGRVRSMSTMAIVAVVTLSAGFVTQGLAWPVDAFGWLGLVLLTLFYGTAITSLFVVLPRMGAVNNAAIMNFEPVSALVLAWLLLGQAIAPIQIVGVLVVITAIVAMSLAPPRSR